MKRLVDDLLNIYPNANVWLIGHSLGGALASLLGSTYGLPAVAFESPGERLAAARLHLPLPRPKIETPNSRMPLVPVTHVYHTGDPIPQGVCTGFGSPCTQAGYALETRCHLGKSIVLDTVKKLGWRVGVWNHPIKDVILKVLEVDGVDWGDGRDVPLAQEEVDCIVSASVRFFVLLSCFILTIGLLQVGIWGFPPRVNNVLECTTIIQVCRDCRSLFYPPLTHSACRVRRVLTYIIGIH